ncbi:substrate-binding periplasmic protein [Lysinibacillus fusiformis]|jgi:ABC-type amino acid transport substrate-binding protein|uniref:substrate-binding periplasmic protein n=1 Tax=Lysinibacillus sp. PWR01 TaxID=3342384 RepID=UPI00372D299F
MKKWFLVILAVATLVLGACGDKQEASTQTALERVEKAGKLVVGTTGNYRPFSYMDKNNKLTGYDIEWATIIADELGLELEFVTGQFSGLIPGLVAGKFDVVLSGANATEERKKSVDFSEFYAKDGAVAVVKKGTAGVSGIEDMEGKIVGVNAGSAFEEVVKKIGGYKDLKTYPGAAESFADLIAGRVDFVAIGLPAAAEYINNSTTGNEIEIIGQPFDEKDIAVAIAKDSDDLLEAINKVIQKKKEDGTFDELAMKYFGQTF